MSTQLDDAGIDLVLKELPEWSHEDGRLNREVEFDTFRQAMGFLVRIAFEAEAVGHYPDIFCVQNRVALSLTSIDAGMNVTQRDVLLANRIEAIIVEFAD